MNYEGVERLMKQALELRHEDGVDVPVGKLMQMWHNKERPHKTLKLLGLDTVSRQATQFCYGVGSNEAKIHSMVMEAYGRRDGPRADTGTKPTLIEGARDGTSPPGAPESTNRRGLGHGP